MTARPEATPVPPAAVTAPEIAKPAHPAREFLSAFGRNQSALLGLGLLCAVIALSLAGPFLYDVDPYAMIDMPFVPPGGEYAPLGTDYLGRDILAGIIAGGKATLLVGASSAVIAVIIGIVTGSLAGYFGGRIDAVLMKITEFFQILPTILLAMLLVSIFGAHLTTIVFAIGIVSWPQVARLARAEFLRIRKLDYVNAARTAGARNGYLIFRVILPAALPPLVVAAGLAVGSAILFEAGLSFLGLGDSNTMSWGLIIGQNRNYLLDAWWTVTLPGVAIFVTVLAISLVGDGINDALNPKLRRR
ncbi:ABC transporter permease [Falsirhodobacter algicola]|uniref:ABC transporter permease subunit n=1 Tax=Falsirhodobacter algicola TaxID=2692330 RepID=A0A8J8MTA3_9RHOB|nr:ABC transporter permease [Falsirhodobacter algicola]QUS36316.1 ABC transporter permease subunit [Falsirhodobacter algicola]